MKIFVGADHNGFDLKNRLIEYLKNREYKVVDSGDEKLDPNDDFTIFASRVISEMKASKDKDPKGILICGSGQGMAIAANRHKGIRAGLGWSVEAARSTRNDEDSNVLALPAEILLDDKQWQSVVDAWLTTPFAGSSRYIRRNKQLDSLS
jgi:ribose 5-phosphate isomerase B